MSINFVLQSVFISSLILAIVLKPMAAVALFMTLIFRFDMQIIHFSS